VDVEELEEGGLPEPLPGFGDPQQAAAEAVLNEIEPQRELHSFEIDPAQARRMLVPALDIRACWRHTARIPPILNIWQQMAVPDM
jgi:hypothetical protein